MSFWENKRKKKAFIIWTSIVALFVIIFIVCVVYLGDYYRGDRVAIERFETQHPIETQALSETVTAYLPEQFPEVTEWYIGGHSLGGSRAAAYVADHREEYTGLILLGSYSTTDLSGTELSVLSVYGSEDRVLNKENYDESKANLPAEFTEVILDGGCHAYFGMYGAQEGDGTPTLSNEEQIAATVDAVTEFLKEEGKEDEK